MRGTPGEAASLKRSASPGPPPEETCGERGGCEGGGFSERSPSLALPPEERLAFGLGHFFGVGSACKVGAFPINLVVVAAADRAAVTCQRWVRDKPISRGSEGVAGAIGKPPPRARRHEIPRPQTHLLGTLRRRISHARQRMTEDTPPHRKVTAALSAAVTTTPKHGKRAHLAWARKSEGRVKLIPSRSSGEGVWGRGASLREAASPPSSPKRSSSEGGPGEGKDSHSRQWRLSMAVFLNRNKRP